MQVTALSHLSARLIRRTSILLLINLLWIPASWAHSGAHPIRYVADTGNDSGACESAKSPCASIAYAVNQATKGDTIKVAAGQYPVKGLDIFYLLSDMIVIEGGYSTKDAFSSRDVDANLTTVVGIPHQYRTQLSQRGFRLLQDSKNFDIELSKEELGMLKTYERISSKPQGPADCVAGKAADTYDCRNIDLLYHFPLASFQASPSSVNDIWGFQDVNNDREYALVGMQNGTSVIDVTDPSNVTEVGFVSGVASGWRDVKVYQFYNAELERYQAYGYVTTEGAQGLQILDLTQLPQTVTLADTINDFATAHNVYLANTNYSTGMALEGLQAFLYIAGSNKGGGNFRVYDLVDPLAPKLVSQSAIGSSYMHDATTFVVSDERSAQCSAAQAPCELLIDYSEDAVDIWDVTDKTSPAKLSSLTYPQSGYVHSGWWSQDGRYVFVQDELDEQQYGLHTTLRVIDLTDLRAPQLVHEYRGTTGAIDHNGFAKGNRYYMSNYRRGLSVLDISDPTNIAEVGFFDTFMIPQENTPRFNGAWGTYPYLPSGNLLVSDIEYGLFVLKDNTGTADLDTQAGRIQFASPSASALESQSAITVQVQRVDGRQGQVVVSYQTQDGSAIAGSDFRAASGELVWNDGDSQQKTIQIELINDSEVESDENFALELTASSNNASIAGSSKITLTITNDDQQSSGGSSGGGSAACLLLLLLVRLVSCALGRSGHGYRTSID